MNRNHLDYLLKFKKLSGLITEGEYIQLIKENTFIDDALDKLILLSASGDIEKLKQLSLDKIYRVHNTFGQRKVKVQIKPVNEQPIQHKFSQLEAGKQGYLSPYIQYSEEHEAYVSVTFDEIEYQYSVGTSATYKSLPIMLKNMFPIGYDDDQIKFVKNQLQKDQERKDFLGKFGMDDNSL